MSDHRITVLPGDGTGREVALEAQRILDTIQEHSNHGFDQTVIPCGGEHYMATGEEWAEGRWEAAGWEGDGQHALTVLQAQLERHALSRQRAALVLQHISDRIRTVGTATSTVDQLYAIDAKFQLMASGILDRIEADEDMRTVRAVVRDSFRRF